jgi:hypothetical protein
MIGTKDAGAAGTADCNCNDFVASFNRTTYGHDCLQINRRLADEAAVEPPQPTGPDQAGSLNSFVEGREGLVSQQRSGRSPVAASVALSRRSLAIEQVGPEPGSVRCCCPDGFQNVELLKN